jgi:hypothetical protein
MVTTEVAPKENGQQRTETVGTIDDTNKLVAQNRENRIKMFTEKYAELVMETGCKIEHLIQLQQNLTLKVTQIIVAS